MELYRHGRHIAEYCYPNEYDGLIILRVRITSYVLPRARDENEFDVTPADSGNFETRYLELDFEQVDSEKLIFSLEKRIGDSC